MQAKNTNKALEQLLPLNGCCCEFKKVIFNESNYISSYLLHSRASTLTLLLFFVVYIIRIGLTYFICICHNVRYYNFFFHVP